MPSVSHRLIGFSFVEAAANRQRRIRGRSGRGPQTHLEFPDRSRTVHHLVHVIKTERKMLAATDLVSFNDVLKRSKAHAVSGFNRTNWVCSMFLLSPSWAEA